MFVLTLSKSNLCLDFVLSYVESIFMTITMSKDCPDFVQLQGDQVVYVKKLSQSFVQILSHDFLMNFG